MHYLQEKALGKSIHGVPFLRHVPRSMEEIQCSPLNFRSIFRIIFLICSFVGIKLTNAEKKALVKAKYFKDIKSVPDRVS